MADKFVLKKGDHKVTTTIPAEAHQLRAYGYSDVQEQVTKPGPKPEIKK